MTQGKHTTGPWEAVENDGAYVKDPKFATWRIEERSTAAEMVIALVVSDVSPLKPEANARLIAAAPEMLEALKGLVSERHGHGVACWCPWCIARAVIAKAEGKP